VPLKLGIDRDLDAVLDASIDRKLLRPAVKTYCNNIFDRLRTCPLSSRPRWRVRTACRGGDSRGPRAGLGRGRPVRGKWRARRQSALEQRS
jgi:hypothetical protein